MTDTPKRRTHLSDVDAVRADADSSRVKKQDRPPAIPSGETARAADSVPTAGGPFTVLPIQFGRFQIQRELGRGQMGAVYLAVDTELDRPVALKVARTSAAGSANLLKRMVIEARSAAKVDHPQICKVYDAGEIDGIRFIALQYVEGEDLKKYLKREGRKRDPAEAVRIILQILRALKAAHENGVIHRDLKPENIMLNKKNVPVIMDFGLARRTIASSDAGLTQGMIVGTAAYMSPEQATGKAEGIDHRSDLYAVGVMLFEMLTGEWPFTGGALEVMGKKCVLEPPSPVSINPTLDPRLSDVCHKMIAKEKGDRYVTCDEAVNALETIDLKHDLPSVPPAPLVKEGESFNFLKESSAGPIVRNSSSKPQKKNERIRIAESLSKANSFGLMKPRVVRWKAKLKPWIWTTSGGTAICLLLVCFAFSYLRSQRPILDQNEPTKSEKIIGNVPSLSLLVDEKLVVDSVGPPIDLISSVDLNRDTFQGEWKKEGISLVGNRDSIVYFPNRVPDDYQLKFRLKRLAERGGIGIGFLMEGVQGVVGFDMFQKFTGLFVDGKDPRDNCTTIEAVRFTNDTVSEIVLTVHPGHLHASFDGQTVIDWHGEARRLWTNSEYEAPNRETPHFRVGQARMQIESAVLIPIKPESQPARQAKLDSTFDLMPLLNTERDSVSGVWSISENRLHSPESGQSLFVLPVNIPEEYTLSATVELADDVPGQQSLVIGLVAGKSYCDIELNNGECLGLEQIDGARFNANETRVAGTFFQKGKPARIACTVTKRAIRMELDGRTLIHWKGNVRRLSPHPILVPSDARKLSFDTRTHFIFSQIILGPPADSPNLPAHLPFEIGTSVNLLSLIDPSRDALTGTWKIDGHELRVMGNTMQSKLTIPSDVPEEYKLTIRLVREAGGITNFENLTLNLPIGLLSAEVHLDSWTSRVSAVALDNLGEDRKNPTFHEVQAIPFGTPQEIVIYVRKTGLKIVNGDNTLVDWSGNSERFTRFAVWGSPDARIVIGSWNGRFKFEKIEIEPLAPSSFPAVPKSGIDGNLISVIDPQRDSRKGQWVKNQEGLVSPSLAANRLRIPVTPPGRYVLTADVERMRGRSHLCFGLVVDGNPCIVALDAGNWSGLENVDGKTLFDKINLTRRSYPDSLLPQGNRIQVRCYVLPDTIVVNCDDREVIRWHGDPRRLSLNSVYQPPNYSEIDRSQLWIGGWDSEFLIRDLRVKSLSDEEAKRITVDTPVNQLPLTLVNPNERTVREAVNQSSEQSKKEVDQKQFTLGKGNWRIDGDQLLQTDTKPQFSFLWFGDKSWRDYDFVVDAMRVEGHEQFALLVRNGEDNGSFLSVAGWGNKSEDGQAEVHSAGRFVSVLQKYKFPIVNHKWYKMRIRVRNEHFECFLGSGEKEIKVFEFTDSRNPQGRVGLRCVYSSFRFRNIKVTAPDGKVFWEGVPALP